jgi:uncharacterized membrane protein YagU involved in acid resistance
MPISVVVVVIDDTTWRRKENPIVIRVTDLVIDHCKAGCITRSLMRGKEDSRMSQESGTRTVLKWVLPGLIAGLVFAMWAMVVGLFASTLWAAPQGIAQSIGIGSPGHNFQLVPFVAGLIGHMMNSIVLGVIFIAIARALRLQGPIAVVGGMVYGVIVYVAMYWVLLRGVLSSTSASFLSANPEWSWIAAHLMFGVVLGSVAAYGPLRTLYGQTARPVAAG